MAEHILEYSARLYLYFWGPFCSSGKAPTWPASPRTYTSVSSFVEVREFVAELHRKTTRSAIPADANHCRPTGFKLTPCPDKLEEHTHCLPLSLLWKLDVDMQVPTLQSSSPAKLQNTIMPQQVSGVPAATKHTGPLSRVTHYRPGCQIHSLVAVDFLWRIGGAKPPSAGSITVGHCLQEIIRRN